MRASAKMIFKGELCHCRVCLAAPRGRDKRLLANRHEQALSLYPYALSGARARCCAALVLQKAEAHGEDDCYYFQHRRKGTEHHEERDVRVYRPVLQAPGNTEHIMSWCPVGAPLQLSACSSKAACERPACSARFHPCLHCQVAAACGAGLLHAVCNSRCCRRG